MLLSRYHFDDAWRNKLRLPDWVLEVDPDLCGVALHFLGQYQSVHSFKLQILHIDTQLLQEDSLFDLVRLTQQEKLCHFPVRALDDDGAVFDTVIVLGGVIQRPECDSLFCVAIVVTTRVMVLFYLLLYLGF